VRRECARVAGRVVAVVRGRPGDISRRFCANNSQRRRRRRRNVTPGQRHKRQQEPYEILLHARVCA